MVYKGKRLAEQMKKMPVYNKKTNAFIYDKHQRLDSFSQTPVIISTSFKMYASRESSNSDQLKSLFRWLIWTQRYLKASCCSFLVLIFCLYLLLKIWIKFQFKRNCPCELIYSTMQMSLLMILAFSHLYRNHQKHGIHHSSCFDETISTFYQLLDFVYLPQVVT